MLGNVLESLYQKAAFAVIGRLLVHAMREDDYDCWFVDTRLNFEQRRLPIPLPIVPTASSHQESAPPTLCSMGNGFSALSAIIWLESAVNRGSGGVVNHRRDRNTLAHAFMVRLVGVRRHATNFMRPPQIQQPINITNSSCL